MIIFIVLSIAFVGIGVYQVSEYQKLPQLESGQLGEEQLYLSEYAVTIFVGSITSIAVAFIYVFLIKMFPRPMVYAMIILSLGLMALGFLIGVFTANIGLMIGMGVTLLIYAIVLGCLRKKI